MFNFKENTLLKAIMLMVFAIGCFYASFAFAQTEGLGGIAESITKSFEPMAKLITAGSFLAGLGFALAAILKFKAHRDNPTQIPIGTPIALLFVAVALLFLPTLFSEAGKTVFGAGAAQETGIKGTATLTGGGS